MISNGLRLTADDVDVDIVLEDGEAVTDGTDPAVNLGGERDDGVEDWEDGAAIVGRQAHVREHETSLLAAAL